MWNSPAIALTVDEVDRDSISHASLMMFVLGYCVKGVLVYMVVKLGLWNHFQMECM